jgi:hypothetical protein
LETGICLEILLRNAARVIAYFHFLYAILYLNLFQYELEVAIFKASTWDNAASRGLHMKTKSKLKTKSNENKE